MTDTPAPPASRTVLVGHEDGLHLRPITELVKAAATHGGNVRVRKGETVADGKAMMQLLTLAAARGDEVTIEADGAGGDDCVEKLAAIVRGN